MRVSIILPDGLTDRELQVAIETLDEAADIIRKDRKWKLQHKREEENGS